MKYNKRISTVCAAVCCMTLPFMAWGGRATMNSMAPAGEPRHLTAADDSLPGDSVEPDHNLYLVRSQMHLLARTYGDSIVLRWAPEDYVSWKYLNKYGYTLYRLSRTGLDTLAWQLKPLSREQMLAKRDTTDSVAMMAVELMWGNGRMKYNQTRAIPGSIEAMVELSEEQNMMFAMAELIAEWRPDLANDMAMRLVDRNVKAGERYQYVLQPGRWDPDSSIIFSPGIINEIENKRYTPKPLDVEITDTITDPYSIVLSWPQKGYSSFEIERRGEGEDWHRVNEHPYVPFLQDDIDQTQALFSDVVPKDGVYGYRIIAHDIFGDLTAPSEVHTVKMTDIDPPSPPLLKGIYIERPEKDPSAKILAHIYWQKDTIEGDLLGFMPMYYNEGVTGKEWKKLLPEPVGPRDTMCVADVTGLRTGMLVIAAYDKAGNMSTTLPQQLRVEDMKAPDAPQNFRADVYNDGHVMLTWEKVNDDVDYYQIAFCNDTTHMWQILNDGGIKETYYIDSLALDVNQKYIYYKVSAVDYSTNQGAWSDILRVERPTMVPPTLAHLDSLWHDNDGISMRWIAGTDATMRDHVVYRKKEGEKNWKVIMHLDADSVKAAGHIINVFDNPPYDRQRRYQYAMESWNTSGISSGKTLVYSVLHEGSILVKANIELAADYDSKKDETRIAWDVKELKDDSDYCYSIYRKAPGDKIFRFVTTVKKGEQTYADRLLKPGDTAEYFVKIVYKDGRRTKPSNTVQVTAPDRK